MPDSNYSYQKLNLSLNSSITDKRVELSGQRITHNEGTQKVVIKLGSNTHDEIDLQPQGSIIVPEGFTKFFVSSAQSVGNSTELIISSPASMEFDNKALTVESIDTLTLLGDSNEDSVKSLANTRFFGNHFGGAVASNYTEYGVFNPASSGKLIIVDSFEVVSSDRQTISFFTLTGKVGFSSPNDSLSKYIGGIDGVGELLVSNSASLVGTTYGGFTIIGDETAVVEWVRKGSFIVPENTLFGVAQGDVNKEIQFKIAWHEVDA